VTVEAAIHAALTPTSFSAVSSLFLSAPQILFALGKEGKEDKADGLFCFSASDPNPVCFKQR